jgi:reverse gyrase
MTMATPLENARKRLAALRAEAKEIERFIEMYERFEGGNVSGPCFSVIDHSRETYPQNSVNSLPVDNVDNSVQAERTGPRPTEIADMMERMIREVGRPMTRGEIVKAFDMRDFEIPAKDKSRYLGTIAWRNKGKFINVNGLGYWLRNVPLVTGQSSSHLFSDVEEPE